jgi:hypothetical protein
VVRRNSVRIGKTPATKDSRTASDPATALSASLVPNLNSPQAGFAEPPPAGFFFAARIWVI